MNLKTAELALLVGVVPRRINQLAKEGVCVRVEHGVFDGPASIQNMLALAANKGSDKEAAIDKEREEARLKKEQADYWEQRNAALRKEFLPASEVISVWSEQIAQVRSGMLAVVPRVRQKVTLSPEDAEVLDREIREAMIRLADGAEIYDADFDADEGDPEGGDAGDTSA